MLSCGSDHSNILITSNWAVRIKFVAFPVSGLTNLYVMCDKEHFWADSVVCGLCWGFDVSFWKWSDFSVADTACVLKFMLQCHIGI